MIMWIGLKYLVRDCYDLKLLDTELEILRTALWSSKKNLLIADTNQTMLRSQPLCHGSPRDKIARARVGLEGNDEYNCVVHKHAHLHTKGVLQQGR